jgi:hypothetical protein
MRTTIAVLVAFLTVPLFAQSTEFEQVLAPFDTMSFGGLLGSQWAAELWVRNDSAQPVNLFPERCVHIGGEFPCTRRIDVPARTTMRLDTAYTTAGSPGVFLYVPRARVNDVHFNLRIRGGANVGTEIPVVREREWRTGKANLLNVPLQFGSRLNLRVYTLDAPGGNFTVRMYGDPGDVLLSERKFAIPMPALESFPPVFAFVNDLSSALRGLVADRVRVEIEVDGGRNLWPLLTITDNATQHVTVVTAQ